VGGGAVIRPIRPSYRVGERHPAAAALAAAQLAAGKRRRRAAHDARLPKLSRAPVAPRRQRAEPRTPTFQCWLSKFSPLPSSAIVPPACCPAHLPCLRCTHLVALHPGTSALLASTPCHMIQSVQRAAQAVKHACPNSSALETHRPTLRMAHPSPGSRRACTAALPRSASTAWLAYTPSKAAVRVHSIQGPAAGRGPRDGPPRRHPPLSARQHARAAPLSLRCSAPLSLCVPGIQGAHILRHVVKAQLLH
jgi:hypothetical protein